MTIIDTHSHIYGEEFREDIFEVVTRAKEAGVNKIFLPNINAASISPMLELCRAYPGFCYPTIGLHPEDIADDWREVLAEMEIRLKDTNHPFIGVGEVGLDYYWSRELYEEQQEAFAIQIDWALEYNLPLIIHTRDAHREMVEIIKSKSPNNKSLNSKSSNSKSPNNKSLNSKSSNSKLTGVFHCFSGSEEEARELLDFPDFMLGIGGVVTFKKSKLPEVLRSTVPLNRIVVETDSPYMAPVPYRGKRNESAYVKAVVEKLAEIYGVSVSEVAEITSNNALKTFPRAI